MSAAAHDSHDEHAFDGDPATVLPADEPRTPGWIPALGVVLFLAAAIWLLADLKGDGPPPKVTSEPRAAATAAVAMPTQPAAAGASAKTPPSPERMAEIKKRMEDARAKRAAGGDKPAASAAKPAPSAPKPTP